MDVEKGDNTPHDEESNFESNFLESEGSLAAQHPPPEIYNVLAGPSTEAQFNRLIVPLRPLACWRVEDMRFEFDSSFVLPEIDADLRLLARLRRKLPGSPLSIFAHADQVGNDEYNKQLSGRRAIAIYALLTRNADLWEQLFSQPLGNDRWGKTALKTMLEALNTPPAPTEDEDKVVSPDTQTAAPDATGSSPSAEAAKPSPPSVSAEPEPGCLIHALLPEIDALLKTLQSDSEPAAEETPDSESADVASTPGKTADTPSQDPVSEDTAPFEHDAGKRKQLYLAYMDRLCGADLKLVKTDFLGHGADAGGKADYQGCSEFNPALLFSQAENRDFEATKDKTERNEENAPNRRVVLYLFRKGARIDPNLWPCPRASEGTAGCRQRFWSDAAERRRNQETRRLYAETKDTFACRFYDRLANFSPCEAVREPLRIRLYDTEGKFIAHAPFRFTRQQTREGFANARGFLSARAFEGIDSGVIEWGFPAAAGENPIFAFKDEIFLNLDTDPDTRAERQLINLGYTVGAPLKDKVAAFQEDHGDEFGLAVTGVLDENTRQAIRKVHDGMADNIGGTARKQNRNV